MFVITDGGLKPVSKTTPFETDQVRFFKGGGSSDFRLVRILEGGTTVRYQPINSFDTTPSVAPASILGNFVANGETIANNVISKLKHANLTEAAEYWQTILTTHAFASWAPVTSATIPVKTIILDCYSHPNGGNFTIHSFAQAEETVRSQARLLGPNGYAESDLTVTWEDGFEHKTEISIKPQIANVSTPIRDDILHSWGYYSGRHVPTHAGTYITDYLQDIANYRDSYSNLLDTHLLTDLVTKE